MNSKQTRLQLAVSPTTLIPAAIHMYCTRVARSNPGQAAVLNYLDVLIASPLIHLIPPLVIRHVRNKRTKNNRSCVYSPALLHYTSYGERNNDARVGRSAHPTPFAAPLFQHRRKRQCDRGLRRAQAYPASAVSSPVPQQPIFRNFSGSPLRVVLPLSRLIMC